MVRRAQVVGRRVGYSRGEVYGAAGWVCYLLGSRAVVYDEGGRVVEEALSVRV